MADKRNNDANQKVTSIYKDLWELEKEDEKEAEIKRLERQKELEKKDIENYITTEPRNHGSNHTSMDASNRIEIRHTFDIFQDQYIALSELQSGELKRTGKKARIKDFIREAIDDFLKKKGVQ